MQTTDMSFDERRRAFSDELDTIIRKYRIAVSLVPTDAAQGAYILDAWGERVCVADIGDELFSLDVRPAENEAVGEWVSP